MRHVDLASEIHGKALNAVQDAYADTRWERVRGAIFSDFGHGSRTSRDTMVSRLAEPAKNVRRAIENLLALQRENDGKYTVEDLLRQMRSADQETVVRAVKHVYAVSKNDGSIATKEMIDELLRVTRSGDPELVRNAVGALSHISDHPNGRMFLFRSEGLAEIIRMLGSEDEAVVRYALTTLHRLLQHIESTRPMARQLGATPGSYSSSRGMANARRCYPWLPDAVHILIFDDVNERNRFALDCDGARRLIRLLTTHEDQPKVVMTAVRCVRVLCAGQDASHLKHLLIEKDALFVLYTNLKKAEEARTRITILACLRNLSDAVSNEQDHAVIVIALLDIIKESERAIGGRGHLQGYSEEEVMFAAGVLSNLTCNNVNNKASVYEANGIGTLVDVLRLRPDKADEMVTEPALCTLRHSTARHGNSSAAQRAFARVDGWEVVMKNLERGGASQRRFNDDGTVYGTGNWHRGVGGVSEYQSMGSELGDGYEPELFGARHAHNDALHGGDNYGLDRIDHSFRMPHNNSDWFDTDL
uniref:Beta-catenin hmp-2 n=1 Tax=Pristionchus pacificus TaxID=54126 RepID=B2BLN1_PRIPA|nr:beta-catenin hmp-2 [Pristionchus pacificus]